MGRAGLNRKTALATLTLTLAAEAPDLDVLGRFGGPAFGFAHHRGFTHSFLGIPLTSAVVVGVVYLFWRLRGRKTNNPKLPPRWGRLFFYACLAGLSHILLDFTNNYGVRPFWPFSEKWYSWDIVFIVEPVMLVLLIAGLTVPALFALVDKEIGAPRRGPRGRVAATLALVGIVLLWGLRDYEHRRAIQALEARTYEEADPVRVSAYPSMTDPFHWYGVAETPAFFALAPVDSLGPEVDPYGQLEIRYKPEETPVTLAAKQSYMGRVYLDWAQYPVTETETLPPPQGGYLVHFVDLRYLQMPSAISRGRGRRALSAAVELDKNLRVVGDVFGFGKDQVVVPEPGQR
ncbi:Membrane-bound metal-dependent hydrolase [Candidatus Sulfotelmatobacter kueseliae]|uniref:Membrane-bound metal-dependent hydrolase n=1 Tax=Candidatus Sulfotelmatobacter kueseliae TaxID=2042962 RepID=A0A2U3L1G1_9BACT|nr:Membrane-bound metal-dependent hydrolase [Candidatus Sulfotelmatobacter kueseliae]